MPTPPIQLDPELDSQPTSAETLEAERRSLEARRAALQAEQAALEAKHAALEEEAAKQAATDLAARQAAVAAEQVALQGQLAETQTGTQSGTQAETQSGTQSGTQTEAAPEPDRPGAPLSFIPHDAEGHVLPPRVKIRSALRSARYGDLDDHDLVRLLDSIEDELARRRFRESIYISLFVWLLIVGLVFFGPKYLWHAPELISPAQALKQRELLTLNSPVLPRRAAPAPKLDNNTLKKLRAITEKPTPPAPAEAPTPATPSPAPAAAAQPTPAQPTPQPLPSAPSSVPHSNAQPVPDTPMPQPSSRPNFSTPNNASDSMRDLLRNSPHARMGSGTNSRIEGPTRGGAMAGGGAQILSDTQGVDFSKWLQHMQNDVMRNWEPLLPEEIQPPLSKRGETYIVITILPDGKIGDMHLEDSTHDVAIDRSAWGALVSEGQYEALPREFHGPNLVIRCHFVVN
jgi:outer membrane biosynthesis protein TonB